MKKTYSLVLTASALLLTSSMAWSQGPCDNIDAQIKTLLQEETVFDRSSGRGYTVDQMNARRNELDTRREKLLQCLNPESRQALLDSVSRIQSASKGSVARQSTSEQVHRRSMGLTKEYRPISTHTKTPEALVPRKITQK